MSKYEHQAREIALTTIVYRSSTAAEICATRVRNLEKLIKKPTSEQLVTAIEVGLAQAFDVRGSWLSLVCKS